MRRWKNTGRKQIRAAESKARQRRQDGAPVLWHQVACLPLDPEEPMQRRTHLPTALAADLGVKLPCMLPLSLGQRGGRCP